MLVCLEGYGTVWKEQFKQGRGPKAAIVTHELVSGQDHNLRKRMALQVHGYGQWAVSIWWLDGRELRAYAEAGQSCRLTEIFRLRDAHRVAIRLRMRSQRPILRTIMPTKRQEVRICSTRDRRNGGRLG
jgi:hypothetical protein